jgi:hypothetical protein
MNVNASLLPALKPPEPAQGRCTMRFAHLLVSEVMFVLKLKHGVGKIPYYFLVSLKCQRQDSRHGIETSTILEAETSYEQL